MTFVEWSALGIFLILLELFSPGIYLIWFGISALIVSGVEYYEEVTLTEQLILFGVLSAVAASAGFFIYRVVLKLFDKSDYPYLNDLAGQHIGKTVVVLNNVRNGETKIKVGDSVWLAVTKEKLTAGDKARIVGVEKNGVVFVISAL